MKDQIAEYLVSLKAEVDNPGFSHLLGMIDTTKLRAFALTTAFAGLTAAVYKFISSAAEKEIELKSLEKQQKKSVENLNAQQKALNAMGKTLNDIKKDKTLKSMYDEVLKFNKEFQTMDISGTIKKINGLRTAFYKLKSAISYTLQEVGKRVLVNLEGPIDRINKKVTKFANWIKDNFVNLTSKIASFVTAFAKGLLSIVKIVGSIGDFFMKLPDALRGTVAVIGTIIALLKSGPLGLIFAAIQFIGAIKDDYDVYKWNKQNRDPNNKKPVLGEDGKPVQVPVAWEPIWEIFDGEGSLEERLGKMATTFLTKMTEAMSKAFDDPDVQNGIAKMFGGEGGNGSGGIIGAITNWLRDETNEKALADFGEALVTFISNGFKAIGGLLGGASGGLINALFGDGTIPKEVFENDANATAFAGWVGGFVGGFFDQLSKTGKLDEAIKGGIGTSLISSILSALVANISENKNADGSINWEGVLKGTFDSLEVLGTTIVNMVVTGISTVENIGTMIFNAIANAIKKDLTDESGALKPIADILGELGKENSIFGEALTDGIVTSILMGGPAGILAGIAKLFKGAIENPGAFQEQFDNIRQSLGEIWKIIWDGVPDETGKQEPGLLKKLIMGDEGDGTGGIVGWITSVWESAKGLVEGWVKTVAGWIETEFKAAINRVWGDFLKNNPFWQQFFGRPEENTTSTVTANDDSTVTITSESGESLTSGKLGKEAIEWFVNHPNEVTVQDGEIWGAGKLSGKKFVEDNGRLTDWDSDNWIRDLWRGNTESALHFGLDSLFNKENTIDLLNRTLEQQSVEVPTELEEPSDEQASNVLQQGQNKIAAANKKVIIPTEYGVPENDPTGGTPKPVRTSASAGMSDVGGGSKSGGFDSAKANQAMSNTASTTMALGMSAAGASSSLITISSAVASLSGAISLLINAANSLQTKFNNFNLPESAMGGRFEGSTFTEVGEDGTEYIIPITKPQRAMVLLKQMFNEMGPSMAEKVFGDLGIGAAGTIGANMSTLGSAMKGLVMNNTYNISAPVNINVTSNGANAQEIGTQAYNLAERHLVKTLMGVYA